MALAGGGPGQPDLDLDGHGMFPIGTNNTAAAESTSDSTPQHDRELLSLLMQGVPRTAHRLWRLH